MLPYLRIVILGPLAKKISLDEDGVEISTAYSLKYQDWYVRNGFGKRPVWDNAFVHGKRLSPFLGFYQVQLDALAALWEAISSATGIPLASPTQSHAVPEKLNRDKFSGFLCHYHLTKKKIDCAGLDLEEIKQNAIALRA